VEGITPVRVYTGQQTAWGKAVHTKYFDLTVNGEKIAEISAVPIHLKELAVGFLTSNAYVDDPGMIEQVFIEDGEIRVEASPDFDFRYRFFKERGGIPLEHVEIPSVVSSFSVNREKIMEKLGRAMNEADLLPYGLISDVNGYYFLAEDVKQENVFYKLVGRATVDHFDLRESFLILSEFLLPEDVIRAAYLGIPVVGTLKLPSDMALRVADALGITIFSVSVDGIAVYTHPARIH